MYMYIYNYNEYTYRRSAKKVPQNPMVYGLIIFHLKECPCQGPMDRAQTLLCQFDAAFHIVPGQQQRNDLLLGR